MSFQDCCTWMSVFHSLPIKDECALLNFVWTQTRWTWMPSSGCALRFGCSTLLEVQSGSCFVFCTTWRRQVANLVIMSLKMVVIINAGRRVGSGGSCRGKYILHSLPLSQTQKHCSSHCRSLEDAEETVGGTGANGFALRLRAYCAPSPWVGNCSFAIWLFNDAASIEDIWRPMIGCLSVEQLVKWELAGETEVLGENPSQRHFAQNRMSLSI
jgi:hypothetical protein